MELRLPPGRPSKWATPQKGLCTPPQGEGLGLSPGLSRAWFLPARSHSPAGRPPGSPSKNGSPQKGLCTPPQGKALGLSPGLLPRKAPTHAIPRRRPWYGVFLSPSAERGPGAARTLFPLRAEWEKFPPQDATLAPPSQVRKLRSGLCNTEGGAPASTFPPSIEVALKLRPDQESPPFSWPPPLSTTKRIRTMAWQHERGAVSTRMSTEVAAATDQHMTVARTETLTHDKSRHHKS